MTLVGSFHLLSWLLFILSAHALYSLKDQVVVKVAFVQYLNGLLNREIYAGCVSLFFFRRRASPDAEDQHDGPAGGHQRRHRVDYRGEWHWQRTGGTRCAHLQSSSCGSLRGD